MSVARTGIGDGRRDARRTLNPTPVAYLDRRKLKERIHGRPRWTGRKDSSSRLWRPARALGTHAKQSPSTGHSAVGLRQAGNSLLTTRPHFTAPSCTLGNQVVDASDGPPFSSGEPSDSCTPNSRKPVAVCSPKQALCELGDRVPGWAPASLSTVESSARGRDANTAYLYERIAEGDHEHAEQPDNLRVMRRGTSHDAAQLVRGIIATRDDRARTAHQVAASTDREDLPDRVR